VAENTSNKPIERGIDAFEGTWSFRISAMLPTLPLSGVLATGRDPPTEAKGTRLYATTWTCERDRIHGT
jgi:hypothetical protein